ncbi:MAG: hypothetical protein HY238_06965 [Acidobacteria bacterium]|nr:hypothetical protein [Acidobacteriota bacterium]
MPAYLAFQAGWRRHAQQLAGAELAGRRALIYPTNDLRCGWIVLSAGAADLRADCISSPRASRLRPALQVPLRDDFFIEASAQSRAVRDFREKVPFPFAEVRQAASGGAVVIWRDLRVAYQEQLASEPHGLYVQLDAAGRILSEYHRWWLTFW